MGRPAVVPPAGKGRGWMRAPVGALGGRWGAFSQKRRSGCGPRGLDPYREVGGPKGPRRRVRAAGSEIGALSGGRRFGVGYWLVTACCWPGALTCTTAIIFPGREK